MPKPIAIDLFCGLGGWTEGLLAAGYDVIGFDNERHEYGEHRYPAQLVLQDVRTIDGSRFAGVDLIVASPPCQEFSYMAMPWKRAKAIARALRGCGDFPEGYTGSRTVAELTSLFDACFRIQREAGNVPLVVENVNGAQPWVGRSRWRFGSFHLWGDVPALMPITRKMQKVPGFRFDGSGGSFQSAAVATKNDGGSWFNVAHNTTSGKGQNPDGRMKGGKTKDGKHWERFTADGVKQGGSWFHDSNGTLRQHSSKSTARAAASAMIAKIPLELARHIGAVYFQPFSGDSSK
jgi:hypothetical protein